MKDSAQEHYEYLYFIRVCKRRKFIRECHGLPTTEPFPEYIDIEFSCQIMGGY